MQYNFQYYNSEKEFEVDLGQFEQQMQADLSAANTQHHVKYNLNFTELPQLVKRASEALPHTNSEQELELNQPQLSTNNGTDGRTSFKWTVLPVQASQSSSLANGGNVVCPPTPKLEKPRMCLDSLLTKQSKQEHGN